jgi:hypothetical protein
MSDQVTAVLASAQEFIAAIAKVGGHADFKIVAGRHMEPNPR